MQIDSRTMGYVLHIRPFATKDDIVRLEWINEWDLLIQFTDGEKYIYDTFTNYFKWIYYDKNSITEEQWKNEFKDKLISQIGRKYISQDILAERVGTSQQMISRYCTGSAMPSPYMIQKLADAIGCDYYDLIYREY